MKLKAQFYNSTFAVTAKTIRVDCSFPWGDWNPFGDRRRLEICQRATRVLETRHPRQWNHRRSRWSRREEGRCCCLCPPAAPPGWLERIKMARLAQGRQSPQKNGGRRMLVVYLLPPSGRKWCTWLHNYWSECTIFIPTDQVYVGRRMCRSTQWQFYISN